jgi:hypothetical protein
MKSRLLLLLAISACGGTDPAVTGEDAAIPDDARVILDDAAIPDAETDAAPPDASPDGGPDDTTAPAPVTALAARPGEWKIGLTWSNPDDADLAGVMVRASLVAPPSSPTEGVEAYHGLGDHHLFEAVVENGRAHHFSLFTHDEAGNYSAPVSISAVPETVWIEGPPQPVQDLGDARAVLHDGRLLLFGYFMNDQNLLELDPDAMVWSNCGAAWPDNGCAQSERTRYDHLAIRHDGEVLAFSGCVNDLCGGPGYLAEAYDPVGDAWTPLDDDVVGYNRIDRDVGGLVDGTVYLMGRATTWSPPAVEAYDVAADAWTNCGAGPDATACAPVPDAIAELALQAISDGEVIHVLAGVPSWEEPGGADRVEHRVYDPAANSWSERADEPFGPRLVIAGIHDGAIWAIGEAPVSPAVLRYDLETRLWSRRAGLPGSTPLDGYPRALGLTEDGRIVMFASMWSNEVWIYRPAFDW